MENILNHLIASEDGKCVWIQFVNGKESTNYDNKEDAINDILNCFLEKRITEMEFFLFIREILFESELEAYSVFNLKSIERYAGIERKEIVNPIFKRCNCKKIKQPHGYFYNNDGQKLLPLRFRYQYEAKYMADLLLKSGEIDDETCSSLRVLIEISKIPSEPIKRDYNLN